MEDAAFRINLKSHTQENREGCIKNIQGRKQKPGKLRWQEWQKRIGVNKMYKCRIKEVTISLK